MLRLRQRLFTFSSSDIRILSKCTKLEFKTLSVGLLKLIKMVLLSEGSLVWTGFSSSPYMFFK